MCLYLCTISLGLRRSIFHAKMAISRHLADFCLSVTFSDYPPFSLASQLYVLLYGGSFIIDFPSWFPCVFLSLLSLSFLFFSLFDSSSSFLSASLSLPFDPRIFFLSSFSPFSFSGCPFFLPVVSLFLFRFSFLLLCLDSLLSFVQLFLFFLSGSYFWASLLCSVLSFLFYFFTFS